MNELANASPSRDQRFFRPRRLGHANLFVSDYEQAAEFYQNVVGFREVYRQPDNMAAFVSNGNTYHDLALTDLRSKYAGKVTKPGMWHMAYELETEADLVDGYNRAKAAGVKFAFMQDHDVAHSLYQFDSDNNLVELYADVIADWREHRSGIIIKQKPEYIPGVTSPANENRNYPDSPELDIVKDAVFHPKKIAHVALVAENYEAMIEYYTQIVGLDLMAGSPDRNYVVLHGAVGNADLTLYRKRPGLEVGLHHLGFEVWDEADLDRSLIALKQRNIAVEKEVSVAARRAVTIKDPDSLLLQFFVNRNWSAENLSNLDDESAFFLL